MAAPKGNKFYMKREKDGREKIYTDPEALLTHAYKYFEWCDKHPLKRKEALKGGNKAGKIISVETDRPYTIVGLCVYCGISVSTFKLYRNREDFITVITHIEEIIEQNQVEGACIGAYKENIIARLLGLVDKKGVDIPLGMTINVSSPKTKDSLQELQEKLQEQ